MRATSGQHFELTTIIRKEKRVTATQVYQYETDIINVRKLRVSFRRLCTVVCTTCKYLHVFSVLSLVWMKSATKLTYVNNGASQQPASR